MFARLRAALAAWIAPTPAPTPAGPAEQSNRAGSVSDHGRAVQARDVQDIHMDTHHHTGGTVTNNNHGGTVGAQMGNVTGGNVNVVGRNTGQVIQADHVTGGIQYGGAAW